MDNKEGTSLATRLDLEDYDLGTTLGTGKKWGKIAIN